jgi:cation diffusion facilitator CzcD-associated flavoprotein CzcO
MTELRDVAVVGGGLAGFIAHATLRHRRVEDVTVFDPSGDDPAGPWRTRAAAIRQRRMRSESDGHCLPTSFPGLAVRSALRRGHPWPVVQSLCDRYHPTVDEFLGHVDDVRRRTNWDEAVVPRRVERVEAVEGGFSIDDAGVFRHVLVATGHPGLNIPEELSGDPRVVHAYEPHEYADDVVVVGAGMAAATEWLNALTAGARVTSVRRREPRRRPLNIPRAFFSRRGLAGYHASSAPERAGLLSGLLEPSYPPGQEWDEPLEEAGLRFRVAAEVNGAEQVICATGFRQGFSHDPLLARLVGDHGLETRERWIVLAPDSTVPALTDDTRTLSVAGVAGQWAYPGADTLVGAKYAARGFLRRVETCRTR